MDYFVKAYKDWKLHSQFQEIVPDDMDDSEFMFNEKQSIRESARTLKKYGSTCYNHIRNNEALVRHDIEKTDTLQGIALKYGCTTEQIRRANRLFASDSLFLRQFLLVPVERTSPYYTQQQTSLSSVNNDSSTIAQANVVSKGAKTDDAMDVTPPLDALSPNNFYNVSNNVNLLSNHYNGTGTSAPWSAGNAASVVLPARPYSIAGELLVQTSDQDPALMHNHNASSNKQSKSLDSVAAMSPEEENRKCINDFLNKIDNTISESRKYVERSKDMITSHSDDDMFVSVDFRRQNNHLNNSYKNNNNRPPQHQRHSSTGSGNSDTAQLLNTTQTRRVQNSLKRLERQQDDFFEL